MQFLIVGASGFLGSDMLSVLREAGCSVQGTCRSADRPELSRFDLMRDRIADCVDKRLFEASEETFGVVCAGIFQIDRCRRELPTTRIVNVDNTITLISDLAERGVRPIFISTSYVFDGQTGYYDESAPAHPVCEYGRQKLAVEERVLAEFPEALILRLDRLVSDRPTAANLFFQWSEQLREGKPIRCIRGQVLAPTATADVALAVLAACRRRLSGVYHVANQEFFSRDELAHQFVEACGRGEHPIECLPQSAFGFDDLRPLKSCLDSTKFVTATACRFTSMREAIRRFLGAAVDR